MGQLENHAAETYLRKNIAKKMLRCFCNFRGGSLATFCPRTALRLLHFDEKCLQWAS